MIGNTLRNIIIGILIGSQVIIGKPIMNYHKLIDKHKHKKSKIINPKNLQSDLANQKLAQFKQQCAETQSIREYEIERQQKLQKQRELEMKAKQAQKLKRQKQQTTNRHKENNNISSLSRRDNGEYINVRLSYYTSSYEECGKNDGISANGTSINDGGNYVAAPSSVPFGTKLNIDGTIYTVVDRGGAIGYSNGVMMLDVYVPGASQEQLNNLGVKFTKAQILK